jgi:hypothetical protein
MDRIVDISDRVRSAMADAGISPDDPLWPVVETLAGIPAEVRGDVAHLLKRTDVLVATAGRAADRPILSDSQIRGELIPALVSSIPWWCAAFGLVMMLLAAAGGYGLRWYDEPTLQCGDFGDGSAGCYYRTRPTPSAPALRPG